MTGSARPRVREPRVVDVDADVAVVDRHERALERVGRGGRRDDALVDRARRERVVDAEHEVAQRRVLGQHELVDQRAAVARLHDLDAQAGLLLERLEDAVGQRERVVRDQRDGAGRRARSGLAGADGRAAGQRDGDGRGRRRASGSSPWVMLLLGRKGGGRRSAARGPTTRTEKPDSLRRYQPDQVRGSAVVRTLSVQTRRVRRSPVVRGDPTPLLSSAAPLAALRSSQTVPAPRRITRGRQADAVHRRQARRHRRRAGGRLRRAAGAQPGVEGQDRAQAAEGRRPGRRRAWPRSSPPRR